MPQPPRSFPPYRNRSLRAACLAVLTLGLGVWPETWQPAAQGQTDLDSLFPEEILVSGKDLKITRSELDREFIALQANKATLGVTISGRQRAELEARLLDKMITTKLLLNKASQADRTKGKEFVDEQMKALETQLGSVEAAQQHIVASGVSEAYFRQQLLHDGITRAVIQREVKGNFQVPKADLRLFYLQNSKQFTVPETAQIRHIFLSNTLPGSNVSLPSSTLKEKQVLIEELRERARKGEEFAQLAKDYTEDPMTREWGGFALMIKGQSALELELPIFRLKKNEISEVLTTPNGIHLVKMIERTPERLRPLDEVEEMIRSRLENQYIDEKLPAYLDALKQAAGVKVHTEED